MVARVDSLIAELSSRHRNEDPRFLTAVRPIAERILALPLPDDRRCALLEMLAETFERDVAIRVNTAAAIEGWQRFLSDLQRRFGLG